LALSGVASVESVLTESGLAESGLAESVRVESVAAARAVLTESPVAPESDFVGSRD
jgi:hypothetical protein